MTDWTDRRRPVLRRYEAWLKSAPPANPALRLEYDRHQAMLMHDLAAVLRAGAADLNSTKKGQQWWLQLWQSQARDPETGKRLFP